MTGVPILLMPLLTIGVGALSVKLLGHAVQEVPKVMVRGGQDSPRVMAELRQRKKVQIVPASPDCAERISNKQICAAVEIPRGVTRRSSTASRRRSISTSMRARANRARGPAPSAVPS